MATDSVPATILRLRGIRAVVFDLDDTLYPERSFTFSGFDAVASWLRQRIECSFDPAQRMRDLYNGGQRRRVFDQVAGELDLPDAALLVPEMIRVYREHSPALELFADARAALATWNRDFRLGLISDGPLAVQRNKVAALALHQWLQHIILTDQWGTEYWKPHPRAFQEAELRLGFSGSAGVYIADNCGKDFVAPRSRGWQTVWMRRPGSVYFDVTAVGTAAPEHQAASFAQLDLASSGS